jgi:hypothetical protein
MMLSQANGLGGSSGLSGNGFVGATATVLVLGLPPLVWGMAIDVQPLLSGMMVHSRDNKAARPIASPQAWASQQQQRGRVSAPHGGSDSRVSKWEGKLLPTIGRRSKSGWGIEMHFEETRIQPYGFDRRRDRRDLRDMGNSRHPGINAHGRWEMFHAPGLLNDWLPSNQLKPAPNRSPETFTEPPVPTNGPGQAPWIE